MTFSRGVIRTIASFLVGMGLFGMGFATFVLGEQLTVNGEVIHLAPSSAMPTALAYVEIDEASFGAPVEVRSSRRGRSSGFDTPVLGASAPITTRTRWQPAAGMPVPGRARGLYWPTDHRLELERSPADARGVALAAVSGPFLAFVLGIVALALGRRPGGLTADVTSTTVSRPGGYRDGQPVGVRCVSVRPSARRLSAHLCLVAAVALTMGDLMLFFGFKSTMEYGMYAPLAPLGFAGFFALLSWLWVAPTSLRTRREALEVSRFGSRLVAAPWKLDVDERRAKGGMVYSVGVRSLDSGRRVTLHFTHARDDAAAIVASLEAALQHGSVETSPATGPARV